MTGTEKKELLDRLAKAVAIALDRPTDDFALQQKIKNLLQLGDEKGAVNQLMALGRKKNPEDLEWYTLRARALYRRLHSALAAETN